MPLLLLAAGVGFLLLVFDEENVLLLKYNQSRITQARDKQVENKQILSGFASLDEVVFVVQGGHSLIKSFLLDMSDKNLPEFPSAELFIQHLKEKYSTSAQGPCTSGLDGSTSCHPDPLTTFWSVDNDDTAGSEALCSHTPRCCHQLGLDLCQNPLCPEKLLNKFSNFSESALFQSQWNQDQSLNLRQGFQGQFSSTALVLEDGCITRNSSM